MLRYTLVFAILVSGCGGDHKTSTELALVNGKTVTQDELHAFLKLKRISATDPARLAQLLDEYLKQEALAAAVESSGKLDTALTNAELNEFRKEMLISRYFQQFLDAQVTDQAVQSYYDTHAAEFEERKVRVAHVLFRTHQRMTPE